MLAPSLQRAADFAAAQWQQRLQRYKIFGPRGHVLERRSCCWSRPPNYCGFGSVFPLFLKEICEQAHYTYWNGPPPVYSSFYCHIRMPECIAVTQRKKCRPRKHKFNFKEHAPPSKPRVRNTHWVCLSLSAASLFDTSGPGVKVPRAPPTTTINYYRRSQCAV